MKTYLELAEIILLGKNTSNLRDKLLIRLLFHLGCRITEALSIGVEDVDFLKSIVTIVHLKRRIKLSCIACGARLGASYFFCPVCGNRIEKKNAQDRENRRQRALPIDKDTLLLLKEYIDLGGPVEKEGKRLIIGVNRHRAWQIVRECAEKASLPKLVNPETGRIHNISPHRLRDAFAVHAVKFDDS